MNKIVILSPFQEFSDLVSQMIDTKKHTLLSPEGNQDFSFEDALETAWKAVDHGAEVIIARGGIAAYLQRHSDIPVVEVNMNILDILRTVDQAKQSYDVIGLVGPMNIICDYHELGNYLDIHIYPIFTYESELDLAIRQAIGNGAEVVIGDSFAVNHAKQFGLPGIKLLSSKNSIKEALNHAENIVSARFDERKKNEQFRMVFESAQNGILIVTNQNYISLANPKAAQLLSRDKIQIIHKPVEDVLSHEPQLLSLLLEPKESEGEIISLQHHIVSVSKRLIEVEMKTTGYVITLQDITQIQQLEQTIRSKLHAKGFVAKTHIQDMVAVSAPMREIVETIKQYSQTESTILIHGETGTGKELVAQSVHNLSQRKNRPFLAINCGALPANLLESELFGYEAGAFTGANKRGKEGLFELAHTGTLFLDEIGEIPIDLQSRLLRILQEKEVMRIGGNSIIPVNVRIIAATHRNLQSDVQKGLFRADLLYRLNVLNLTLPPLCQRLEDIPFLLDRILIKICSRYELAKLDLPPSFVKMLSQYSWPGNIRELENILERIVVLSQNGIIQEIVLKKIAQELQFTKPDSSSPAEEDPQMTACRYLSEHTLEEIEKTMILYHFKRNDYNRDATAGQLGISRATLWRKLKAYGIERDRTIHS